MAEHIKREAAIRVICDCCAVCADIECCDYAKGSYGGCKEIEGLRAIPTADVKPVVHGRWIEYPDCLKYPNAYADDHIVCSVCEECFSVLDNDTARFWFCPHCGADLREG